MKLRRFENKGSILMMALLSITILTLICATSLYIASQNTNSGVQTAAWQQSLTAAESGVDAAVRALNTGVWTNWRSALPRSATTAAAKLAGRARSLSYDRSKAAASSAQRDRGPRPRDHV